MKIIFLDVDGVLNSEEWQEKHKEAIKSGLYIDETKVELLAEIVRCTGAKVVLHSGWRFWFDSKMQPLRAEAGNLVHLMTKYQLTFYGQTPDFSTETIKRNKTFSVVKAKEILAWLKVHSEVSGYVVLDDMSLHCDKETLHHIQTDPIKGLIDTDVKKAIEWLS